MALTADRATPEVNGIIFSRPMAASAKIYKGAIACLDTSGNIVKGSATTGLVAVGRSNEQVDNSSGSAGDLDCEFKAGIFGWDNSVGDAVTAAEIGDTVYIEDDHTVCKTATGKSAAGRCVNIDDDGVVYVETRPPSVLVSGLAVANNLSDVGTPATAATNLGLGAADDVTHNSITTVADATIGGDAAVAGALDVAGAISGLHNTAVKAAAYTVADGTDGDMLVQDLTDAAVITLPNAAATNKGQRVTIQNTAADGAALLSVSPHSSDKIKGTIGAVTFGGVADKDIQNTKVTAIQGDYVTLQSDGVDTWWVVGGVGVWASEA